MISLASSSDPQVLRLLRSHPRVEKVEAGQAPGVQFTQGAWQREVRINDFSVEPGGLVEMMDNNPMVCADVVSIPSGAATLALIAFGPLIDAGLLVESPTLMLSSNLELRDPKPRIDAWLETLGWMSGAVTHVEDRELENTLAATAIAAILTPGAWEDIDSLYEERFGRSFFVRRDEDSVWATSLVEDEPFAVYRLRYTPDVPHSLLSISLLADKRGKVGAAQVIHAMNVMAGLEESLGVA